MSNLKKKYLDFLKKQSAPGILFHDKIKQLNDFYLPVCEKLYLQHKLTNKQLLIGLSGGQGSGKSTLAQIFKLIFTTKYKLKVICFSIDDFYKTAREREKMSKLIHPLFLTRGVPGTHDIKMLYNVIKKLKKKKFYKMKIPKFDKSKDDRIKKNYWQKIKSKPDLIIFEGWCVGAKSQQKKNLIKPINRLEKQEDKNLTWRKMVNNELKLNYKKIFKFLDCKIFLKVPSFKYVLKWRMLQEKKLSLKLKKKLMDKKQIRKFIMLYERITKQMIADCKSNDIILNINKQHKIKSIEF